jgi:hypothetical protein
MTAPNNAAADRYISLEKNGMQHVQHGVHSSGHVNTATYMYGIMEPFVTFLDCPYWYRRCGCWQEPRENMIAGVRLERPLPSR